MKLSLRKIFTIAAISSSILLTACGQEEIKPLRVGVMAGLEFDVAKVAQKIAKEKYALDVELVSFTDYVTPNRALDEGSIDLNAFQHQPYLDAQIKDRGYKIQTVGKTFVYPIAAYSNVIKSVDELKEGAKIAVPNDPSNLGRALMLLEKQGIITLKEGAGVKASDLDIIANPKHIEIIKLEGALLARSLDEVDLAIINNTFASKINLFPNTDGLFVEDLNSPYVNIIVARDDNKDDLRIKEFIEAYQTDEVYEEARILFNDVVVKGW